MLNYPITQLPDCLARLSRNGLAPRLSRPSVAAGGCRRLRCVRVSRRAPQSDIRSEFPQREQRNVPAKPKGARHPIWARSRQLRNHRRRAKERLGGTIGRFSGTNQKSPLSIRAMPVLRQLDRGSKKRSRGARSRGVLRRVVNVPRPLRPSRFAA